MKAPLPINAGVAPSRQWLPAGPWVTLLDFLQEYYPHVATTTWLNRLAQGQVVDENGTPCQAASAYRAGACIFYYREVAAERSIPFAEHIIYQDEHILVADKPHFLPVIPAGRFLRETLLVRLQQSQVEELVPLHRIDRDTAGLVLFSRNPATRGRYASLFQQRQVRKVYEANAHTGPGVGLPFTRRSRIVAGEPFFRMREIAGEPNSETHIEVIRPVNESVTLYRLHPVTGRKHQLRLHLAASGRPLVNDRLYPEITAETDGDFSQPLQLLAKTLSFKDPLTGAEHYFASTRTLWLG